ncbi:branched-chain amino acid ABC transporter permease [Rhizobium sp. PP-CC-2G-626]|uniref:branched-chain amino acid ABC transporter permease n=1 Tax=Rhizobium sp. PP-CC-3G-465 TaxID=2135648 RepID=UPI000D831E1B|nr:amino acid/amide ABC transporter membrane protein 2 (HAAT family) [Rhizobium sp. PP-WC-1G-195]TCP81598.1 amino acid/amide ABC transporter membrane protein 2 (HAAT family) [Rhizobium sp. PP-CC-2G-626]TCQ05422.1 amino acid/amide ABC transporter membrane protein 2 (HAAT family) [Rhizobium sp. PP-F2F-G36]TCQ26061.1 amino acid/amide ABC transporter membrane protein 2 (HAAT family) [Rhizobium sp. PP-CC-3G-465]
MPSGLLSRLDAPLLPIVAGLLVTFAVIPAMADDYWLSSIIIPTLVMGLAGIGLNLLQGYAGLVSLGSAAFMLIGAFSAYNLILRVPGLPLPLVLLISGLIAAAAGVVFGLPSLRIRGFYLGASTLGAQFFFEWLFSNFTWFSNDSQSLTISAPRLEILGYSLQSPLGRYFLAASVTVLLIGLAFLIVRSRLGREWMAIRDMETAASVLGIRVARRKLQAYAISSFFLGVTGVLWAFAYLGTSDAHTFNLDKSFQVLFIVLIGGVATIFGNFLGAAFIVLTPILLDRVVLAADLSFLGDQGALTNLQRIIFGAIIILLLIKEPDGLSALLRRARQAIRNRYAG